jgi:hypothetical protein
LFKKSKMMWIFLLIIHISELNFIQKFEVVWKESLNNGGGHLFHQYQQNEQSPLILAELTGIYKSEAINQRRTQYNGPKKGQTKIY